MQHGHEHQPQQPKLSKEKSWWFSFSGVITIIFIVLLGYYLLTEHRTHVAQFLSTYSLLFIILLCPLMHLFMHGKHHGHKGDHHRHKEDDKISSEKKD